MVVTTPKYEILTPISEGGIDELKLIEKAARTCYKSEHLIEENGASARRLVRMLIDKKHEAMLEHSILSVKFTVDRGVSHELVRHREASFAQESTRYCNYANDRFNGECVFVLPSTIAAGIEAYDVWQAAMQYAEQSYFDLLNIGLLPEQARAVLPNSLKTEIVVTANYREWRHILDLRCAPDAHPDMRYIMSRLLYELKDKLPDIFDDIWDKYVYKPA